MIRLPTTHAAITAPLVASHTTFPGIPIGRSLLDGRAFHLSPVQTSDALLPATNSLALGGLGSGKSTTAKTRIRREILDHGHQAVVIDSFGEDNSGEWAALARALGGRVIEAGTFTLNPVSALFPPEVREQLVRSLILAVEPGALTYQATHALQHALNHPKATSLNGLVDALVSPEDGRWPAAKLTEWGEGAAIGLSRFTEGSLRGLFDGQDASLPETDLPILSFDFSHLDRNSPAIPSLMAAVSCWVEQVWLRQSTAVHRHLVLEEAWQILLSPATAELIQRLLKNSRKAGMSLDVLMHTLSDLGEGKARDLARLCEIAHVGRLNPEEAAIVGAILGLPAWAVDRIPTLDPGQAVWKVGPDYVDIIQTLISDEEAALTDTSARRRRAQQAPAVEQDTVTTATEPEPAAEPGEDLHAPFTAADDTWDWETLPPNVIDAAGHFDLARHEGVLQAALDGRFNEASQTATVYEREDIATHGLNSTQALAWLETRAQVADLRGDPGQAAQLRATVARMGNDDAEWFEKSGDSTAPAWHSVPQPPTSAPTPDADQPTRARRRTWPYVAAVAALSIAAGGVWMNAQNEHDTQEREQKAAAYKGRSGAALTLDGVKADVVAHWTKNRDNVIVELRSYFDKNARYLRIDGAGKSAQSTLGNDRWFPKDPEIELPVTDPLADVTVHVAIGGRTWKEGSRAASQTVRLSPTGIAYDAQTGDKLPSDL
ncbi:hypothetical protein [Streptomyces sp. YU58]|uniref:hypothetical protein n=1 Tax=Streptomyces sp. SX92 TaxID=3158972 RepID=UPI0027BB0B96|nr:hypothetical protein [Streptomyces coralus]WLW53241.1 hypothetical protein QU709_18455 [Streptomyces coralus]